MCKFIIQIFCLCFVSVSHSHAVGLTTKAVFAKNGMVTSADELASKVGVEILKNGGNAVDAAVAVGFALAVTVPRAGNLGGGGFMMIHLADKDKTLALDFREMAPISSSEAMYLTPEGNVDNQKSRHTRVSSGVPGSVRGLEMALNLYGTMSLEEVMKPAIKLAWEGFKVPEGLHQSLLNYKDMLRKNPTAFSTLYTSFGMAPKTGDILRQPDLARTLSLIARGGADVFYEGYISDLIVADMKSGNGIITKEDLKKYYPVVREPIFGNFNGYKIASMPPPSSGGVHLVQMLNILDEFDLKLLGYGTSKMIHILVETMRLAYADRSKYLGDPDFNNIPVERLTSLLYADRLRKSISSYSATPSSMITPGYFIPKEGHNTTHYSVMDKDGNAVACTTTLNFSYGNGVMIPGAGFFMNNEMDDFSSKPNTPNAYGLIGSEMNKIEPRKRPLSSMTPTIVLKNGEVVLVTGSQGGSRIITSVLQVLLNVLEFDKSNLEATSAPRVHHQWLPDVVYYEPGVSKTVLDELGDKGHEIKLTKSLGVVNSIRSDNGMLIGTADHRKIDGFSAGY